MKLPARREYHDILDDTIAPALARFGFSHRKNPIVEKRREDDFIRVIDDGLAHVVSTQETQYASDTHTKWTLNIAVYVPELRAIRGFPPDDHVPDASSCFASLRIAQLLPPRDDELWYEVGSDGLRERLGRPEPTHPVHADYAPSKPATVRRAIARDLEDVVVPYLEPLRSKLALHTHLTTARAPGYVGLLDLVALELALGKLDEARARIEASLMDREDILDYAKRRYGLTFGAAER